MAAVNQCQAMGATPINASSCFAEREVTLSQIDSMYQNGEINQQEADRMATQWLIDNKADGTVFATVLKR